MNCKSLIIAVALCITSILSKKHKFLAKVNINLLKEIRFGTL